jgi:hypothetical protein
MRLFAVSDLHGKASLARAALEAAAEADAVVVCGDISNFGHGLREVCEVLSSFKSEVVVVPGNCDLPRMVEELCGKFGLTYAHGRLVEVGDVKVACVGGSTWTPFDTPFELSEDEIASLLSSFSGVGDVVLATHCPPHGTKVDKIFSGAHVGSKAIREYIERERPLLCLCGHVHERGGEEDAIGRTRVVNVARRGALFELRG